MATTHHITVTFFALLREQANCREVMVETTATSPAELYAELMEARGLSVPPGILSFAVNQNYVPGDAPLHDGDHVAFLPPVAGG